MIGFLYIRSRVKSGAEPLLMTGENGAGEPPEAVPQEVVPPEVVPADAEERAALAVLVAENAGPEGRRGRNVLARLALRRYLPVLPIRIDEGFKHDFWTKIRRHLGHLPFLEEALAAYYCVVDTTTPARVRAVLAAALAYFVLPADLVPDLIALFGFSDDAAVLALLWRTVSNHIKDVHRHRAQTALALLKGEATTETGTDGESGTASEAGPSPQTAPNPLHGSSQP